MLSQLCTALAVLRVRVTLSTPRPLAMNLRSCVLSLLTLTSAICGTANATEGAAFTTSRFGTLAPGNLYPRAAAVYLALGPGPGVACNEPGLADGLYYFQVTDPSGSTLLSTDKSVEDRLVLVSRGVLSNFLGTGHTVLPSGPCSSKIVQLMPFESAPNGGIEYRVWITRVEDYATDLSGFFGFQADRSLTSNFRIGALQANPQTRLVGHKFFDANENGAWDTSDPREIPIPGWRVEIQRNGVLEDVTFTNADGQYEFLRNRDGSAYTLREVAPGGFIGDNVPGAVWLAKTPRQFTVIADQPEVVVPPFGNVSFSVRPLVGRTKGYWHNNNGRADLELCDPLWRSALTTWNNAPLCLRRSVSSADPALSIFAPLAPPAPFATAFDDFAAWIVGNPANGHAGFILSTQVAAAVLNRNCGQMQFNAYIDRFQNGVLVSFDDMLTGVQALLCDPGAGLTGPNDSNQALRDAMLGCINEFRSINNTGDASAPQVVFGPDAVPRTFVSPYFF